MMYFKDSLTLLMKNWKRGVQYKENMKNVNKVKY